MKILILASAGGEAYRQALVALVRDVASRHDVRVLAPDAEGPPLRALGVPVESWRSAGLFHVLRSIGALRRAAERHAPDVIHAFGWTAAAVALGTLAPARTSRTIVTLYEAMGEGEMPKQFVDKRLPELLQRAGYVVCGFASLARTLVERFGVDPERVEVIPYGVAPSLPLGATRPTGRDGPIVGYYARLQPGMPWEIAVEAIAAVKSALPGARLRFRSAGVLRQLVRAHARSRDVEQRVLALEDESPAEFFAAVDMVVVPQGRDSLPSALPQALVEGVPVITRNAGAAADTLGRFDTGWLVHDGVDGLAAGVRAVWEHIDEAWAGARAQREQAVALFQPAAVGARMESVYARTAALGDGEDSSGPLAQRSESR
ncbi:MAG: glycogen synthase [Candidatus Elarobacter sp.]